MPQEREVESESSLIKTEFGAWLAPGLPQVHVRDMHYVSTCLPAAPYQHFTGAMIGLIHRHRTASMACNIFQNLWKEIPEDMYEFNETLFRFFESGLAALECAAYASFAMGYQISREDFDLADARTRRRVSPKETGRRFSNHFPEYSLGATFSETVSSRIFGEWGAIRNELLHQAIPKRKIVLVIGEGITSHTWSDYAMELDGEAMLSRLEWLQNTLKGLLAAMWEFAHPKIVVPGDERKRRGDLIRI